MFFLFSIAHDHYTNHSMAHIRNFFSLVAAEKERFQIAFELPFFPRFSLALPRFCTVFSWFCTADSLPAEGIVGFPMANCRAWLLQQLMGRNLRDVLQLLSLLPPQLERAHLSLFSLFSTVFFFLPPNTSEIETLPFAYFFKTLNSTLSQNEKDGWKMKGYASIQCWAPQPSPHPHGRLQSCWFLDPWRDPLDTSPGWPTAQNSQAAVSFALCTCCLGNADFLWGANCLGQVDGY